MKVSKSSGRNDVGVHVQPWRYKPEQKMRTIRISDLKIGSTIVINSLASIEIDGLYHDVVAYRAWIHGKEHETQMMECSYTEFAKRLGDHQITVTDLADHCNLGDPTKSYSNNQDGYALAETHNQIINLIIEELIRAELKHPDWPTDVVYKAAIVSEESGELMRAAVQYEMEGGGIEEVRTEAIQTAATCIRLLLNLPDGKKNESKLVDPLKEENERLRSIIEKADRALEFYDAEFLNRGLYNDTREMMKRAIREGY